MSRKTERTRRVGRWLAIVAVGTTFAGAAAWALPVGGAVAALAIVAATLAIGHRQMIAPPGVAILTYHSISPDPGWLPWSREIATHPVTFERHLATLARMRATVLPTRAIVAMRARGEASPRCPVALHFDDGYLDNHRHAAPLLDRHGFPATFFPSIDFIEPEQGVRRDGADDGYMRWDELADLARRPGFEIEPHGVAHARIPISDRTVGVLTAANWRANAWMQWAAMPGAKHDWYRRALPSAVPLGSAIPESGLALAERGWRAAGRETVAELERRIERDLDACRTVFAERLNIAPAIFCWPENKVGAEGRRIAAALGYRATTAGRGRNATGESPAILSRVHMGDRALGVRWLPAESLYLRATVRLMQGNHYWYLLLAPMHLARKSLIRLRIRFGSSFV